MAQHFDELDPRQALVEIARDFHARGWMSGTAGNLSVRADREHFWITASGKPKGRLDENDFLLVQAKDGAVVEQRRATDRPSAETAIHANIRELYENADDTMLPAAEAAIAYTDTLPNGEFAIPEKSPVAKGSGRPLKQDGIKQFPGDKVGGERLQGVQR